MFVTREKARELACPMVLPSGVRTGCRPDECMAWRWRRSMVLPKSTLCQNRQAASIEEAGAPGPAGWGFVPTCDHDGTAARWEEPAHQADARREGYCGMAANPI